MGDILPVLTSVQVYLNDLRDDSANQKASSDFCMRSKKKMWPVSVQAKGKKRIHSHQYLWSCHPSKRHILKPAY